MHLTRKACLLTVASAVAVFTAGGCSHEGSKSSSSSSSSSGAGTTFDVPHRTLADSNAPAPSEPAMITLHQSGGIAGVDRHVNVWPSGQVRFGGKGGAEGATLLSPQRLSDVTSLFDDWDKMKADYPAPKQTADAFRYEITYQGKTVKFSEASAEAPKSLKAIAEKLNGLTTPTAGK